MAEFWILWSLMIFLVLGIWGTAYVLGSLGLYRIAKNRGFSKP